MENKSKSFSLYEKYMLLAGFVGQLPPYIQGIKILQNQASENVSMLGFLIALLAVTSWLIYGIMLKNKALIFSNVIGVIGSIFVLILILIHK